MGRVVKTVVRSLSLAPVQCFGDQARDHLRRRAVLPRRRVRVDLLRHGLVGVTKPVGDDLPVDAEVTCERRIGMALMRNSA